MPYDDFDEDEDEVNGVGICFALFMFIVIVVGAMFLLSSCTYADKEHVVFVGGKGAYKSKYFALNTDNEKSFGDAAMLGAIAVPAAQAVALGKSADKLSAIETTSAASVTKHAATQETIRTLGAQNSGVEIAKIPH